MHDKELSNGGESKSMASFHQFEEWQPHLMAITFMTMVW
jgi:hypothetical protein